MCKICYEDNKSPKKFSDKIHELAMEADALRSSAPIEVVRDYWGIEDKEVDDMLLVAYSAEEADPQAVHWLEQMLHLTVAQRASVLGLVHQTWIPQPAKRAR